MPPRRPRPDPAPTTPDPIEIAMEAEAQDTAPDSPARTLLLNQNRLVIAQIASERTGLLLKRLTGLAGLAVVAALATLIWQASQARGIVVEAFSVPPDLAARGLTGEVVANQLLDRLSAMQAKTRSGRATMKAENGWGGLKVEIPQTGISLGELSRYLRQWLGDETRVAGEIVRTPAGLVLTVRAGDAAGASVTGAEADLEKLMQISAEQVYKQTQPFRYTRYLLDEKRYDEYLPALQGLADGPPGPDAATAKYSLSKVLLGQGDFAGATRLNNEALAMAPDDPVVVDNFRSFSFMLGREEARREMSRRLLNLVPRRAAAMTETGRAYTLSNARADLAETSGDFLGAARWEQNSKRLAKAAPNISTSDPGWIGSNLALAHDAAAADAAFADDHTHPDGSRFLLAQQELKAAVALGRWSAALVVGEALRASIQPGWDGSMAPGLALRLFDRQNSSLLGLAMVMSGDIAGGEAKIAAAPLDCYDCVRVRGQLAGLKGDWAGADHWFAQAVKIGPSLPYAHADWGRVLLDRGQPDRAIAQFEIANTRGPHFADPLSWWGEALLRKGETRAAIKKFREADKYAPKWGRNHLLWGDALAKLGKTDEAREQWRAAATMDLSAADRAALKAHGV